MEREIRVAPIDGLPAAPGRDEHGWPLLGLSAVVFWAGELLTRYVIWLPALVFRLTAVAIDIDVADIELASFLTMATLAGGLLHVLAEVEADDDEALLVDTTAVARLVGAYAIFLLALVATVMPVVVGLPRRAIPSETYMLLSAVIWFHLQLWLP